MNYPDPVSRTEAGSRDRNRNRNATVRPPSGPHPCEPGLGLIGTAPGSALKWHATFLVVAQVAMVLGMLDPVLLSYQMTPQH